MWHVVERMLDYQPEDSGAGAGIEWYGGVQEKKLTWEEWNIKDKPTLLKILKIPRELQEGRRLLQLQRGENGGLATIASHSPQLANGGLVGGLATITSHGPQLANGGLASHGQANVSFISHH